MTTGGGSKGPGVNEVIPPDPSASPADALVKVLVPTADEASIDCESLWAIPRDVAAGEYEIESVGLFTDGVSAGDVVRCEPNGEHRLVVVEVLERSPRTTIAVAATRAPAGSDDEAVRRRLGDRLADRFGPAVLIEGGMGFLAIQYDADLEDAVFGTIATDGTGSGVIDPADDRLGEWQWTTVAHPSWTAPERLAGADDLLARTVDLVVVDWPNEDDSVVAAWPQWLVRHLRDIAAVDARMRAALDERRYLAAIVPSLRRSLGEQHGMERVGPQPFPIYPPEGDTGLFDEDAGFTAAWWGARRHDGTVRWCADPEVDRIFRDEVTALGLDPDADPRDPVT